MNIYFTYTCMHVLTISGKRSHEFEREWGWEMSIFGRQGKEKNLIIIRISKTYNNNYFHKTNITKRYCFESSNFIF